MRLSRWASWPFWRSRCFRKAMCAAGPSTQVQFLNAQLARMFEFL